MNDARALSLRLAELLSRERAAMADFVVALANFDRERRWLELGYGSLFDFLHRELGLSKGAAFYRKVAAELVRRYPEIVAPLRDGRLRISSLAELAKVITPENRSEVVARFFHASAREAKAISAELCPMVAPPQREVVTSARGIEARAMAGHQTKVARTPALDLAQAVQTSEPTTTPDTMALPAPEAAAAPRPVAAPPLAPATAAADAVEALTADLCRLHLTVPKRLLTKVAAARDALSHSHPGASTADVLEAALDLLLERHARRKGLVKKPLPGPARRSEDPRHIPAAVKRAVWIRDGGRCQWPLASAGVCNSTTRLELDHVVPIARGGASTVANLRVVCRVHNQHGARVAFGEAHVERAIAERRAAAAGSR